uniref:Helicase C-terminal domain-containing protein n=1 Tax=Anopheles maculatus TaxID=74869 RepID=A0A182SSK5_9DIPT
MRHFRSGACNTLIATCVAEEGIDVGEVDLIVCFDVAKNPIRFVQRIGRTGRQRVGRVLMLVTEGEEHDTLKRVLASKDKTNQQLARSKDILRILYRHSPTLVPAGLQPTCVKMFMNISDEPTTVHHAGSDSSDGEVQNIVKGSNRKRRNIPMDDATETIESLSKRKKSTKTKTRDVREFFQRQRNVTTDELDASECDIFAVDSANQKLKDSFQDRSHGNTSILIDQTIRHGRTDAEVAIAALLQPLIRHVKQLCRQKCLYKQKLLQVPKAVEIERKEPSNNVLVMDDPLDLPELIPRELVRSDVAQAAEESLATDRSISNLFDSTLSLSETTTTSKCLWKDDARKLWKKPERIVSVKKSRVSMLKKPQTPCTSPKNLCNSPLLLAFNRSVKKRKNSDTLDMPDRNTSQASEKQKIASVSEKMVLEFFLLQSLEQIFVDDSSQELGALGTASIAIDQRKPDKYVIPKGPSINRRLFDELKNTCLVNVPSKLTTSVEGNASTRTNLVTTLDTNVTRQEQTITKHFTKQSSRVMGSSNNFNRKNFDLGSAELVFQDDSNNEYKSGSISPSKSSSRESIKSHIITVFCFFLREIDTIA